MNNSQITKFLFFLTAILSTTAAEIEAPDRQPTERRPTEFAIIYNMGYAGDHLPGDKTDFETLIKACKEAHYNVVLCKYTDWRAEICRKHGVKIMVDLLVSDHHVYKNPDAAMALCQSLRNSDVIYGYHLWSDRVGPIAGRNRDLDNVHRWDPNHPAYVGDYHARSIASLKDPDIIGYYDFHWKRGGHFRHLHQAWSAARKTKAPFLKYTDPEAGRIGAGNYNRVLYTICTSIAFGLKGYTYHQRGDIDTHTWAWKPLGEDLKRINGEVASLGAELMGIGIPTAVYSTPVTRTAKDRPIEDAIPIVPPEFKPVPKDYWVNIDRGEVIMGVFRDGKGRDVLFLANHNAYQKQAMELTFSVPLKSVEIFDRKLNKWIDLANGHGTIQFSVPPAAGELIRIVRSGQEGSKGPTSL